VTDNSFSINVAAIRDRARQKMDRGPVTEDYGADPAKVVEILNEVLSTEIVCWMRYTRHAISATGINRAQVSSEFTEHAEEERGHAMRVAERISQLGGDQGVEILGPFEFIHGAHARPVTPMSPVKPSATRNAWRPPG
jgi:bacterioferritin